MSYRRVGHALLLAAAVTFSLAPAMAHGQNRGDQGENDQGHHGRGHGRGHWKNRGRERDHESDRRGYFQDRDRDTIAVYYREHGRDLPPGLARRESLPPGLERQLRRNGELPPGLRRRIVWVPPDLDRQLGPLPPGYRRCWVGDNLLVVNPRTYGIFDVMLGVSISFR